MDKNENFLASKKLKLDQKLFSELQYHYLNKQ